MPRPIRQVACLRRRKRAGEAFCLERRQVLCVPGCATAISLLVWPGGGLVRMRWYGGNTEVLHVSRQGSPREHARQAGETTASLLSLSVPSLAVARGGGVFVADTRCEPYILPTACMARMKAASHGETAQVNDRPRTSQEQRYTRLLTRGRPANVRMAAWLRVTPKACCRVAQQSPSRIEWRRRNRDLSFVLTAGPSAAHRFTSQAGR